MNSFAKYMTIVSSLVSLGLLIFTAYLYFSIKKSGIQGGDGTAAYLAPMFGIFFFCPAFVISMISAIVFISTEKKKNNPQAKLLSAQPS